MFTVITIYHIFFVLLGAASVRGYCWITPNEDGVVNIPDGTEQIPESAFDRCDALKAVNIPASVYNVRTRAFEDTSNLETVIFEEGSILEVIGNWAFRYSSSLKKITFPATLKEIGELAFQGSGLEEVIFEEGSHLKFIDYGAFRYCEELKVITLPPALKEIGTYAFMNSGFEEVIFAEGSHLKYIGINAFWQNKNLKSINIPSGVVIGSSVFKETGCPEDIFTPGATIVDCKIPAERESLGGNEYDL